MGLFKVLLPHRPLVRADIVALAAEEDLRLVVVVPLVDLPEVVLEDERVAVGEVADGAGVARVVLQVEDFGGGAGERARVAGVAVDAPLLVLLKAREH